MEPVGAFFDEEYYQSLSKMFFTENSSDFMFQLHGDHPSNNIIEGSFFSSPNSHIFNSNTEYFSQENSIDSSSRGSDGMFFLNNNNSTTSHEYLQHYNDESTDFYMMGYKNLENSVSHDDYIMKEMVNIGNNNSQLDNEMLLKRKFDEVELQSVTTEDQKFKDSENPKKKSRVSRDHGPKNKKSGQAKAKKNQKNIKINNEEAGEKERNNNAAENCQSGQSTSSCSSEDDSNGGTDLKTKTRASRGAATDPQSLYARKRRERINERLRILQSLVPNGTKLLSSDDMWMYAPIVYNGMGIDLSHT
ncbi:hypothetical protein HAX54_045189 [Datura stramonium]|uniref:BHLH domain-containing protein n=1 Tax=Datura stramonium TaxID=4076 RepID=A0ABS8SQR5_DATST|nr:hypothetical protein [Datura stramonium]